MNKDWKRNVVLFLASQTISLFGSSLVQYAIIWHITLQTQSGAMMTVSILCGFLPQFVLSPFAGVWADRYSRKTLIMVSDSMIALCTLAVAVLFLLGYDMLWVLFLASALRALGSAVQTPAVGAFLPQIVPEDKLMKVNATNGSIQSLVMLASPMLSGVLLTVFPIELVFFIDVGTAAIAVLILLLFLHVPVHKKALLKQTTGYFSDMKTGFAYIARQSYLKHFFVLCACFYVLVAPAAFLTPLQVTRSFGSDIWRLTAIEIAFSLGMLVGGLVMAAWGGFKNKIHTMSLATFLIGMCTLAMGIVPDFWIYLAVVALTGIFLPIFNTPATVLLQERVEESFLGRVFSILSMISSIMMPLGMLAFGPLADVIRIEWLLIGTGVLIFIEGFFMHNNKALLSAAKPQNR